MRIMLSRSFKPVQEDSHPAEYVFPKKFLSQESLNRICQVYCHITDHQDNTLKAQVWSC